MARGLFPKLLNKVMDSILVYIGLDKQHFERKIVNSAQKNRLIETVLLSTHNICFSFEYQQHTVLVEK